MDKNQEYELVLTFLVVALIFVLIFVVFTTEVSVKGECGITGVNTSINETGEFKGLKLNEGSFKCTFEAESPWWYPLILRG